MVYLCLLECVVRPVEKKNFHAGHWLQTLETGLLRRQ